MTFIFLRAIYSILFAVFLPFIFLRLILKGAKIHGYRARWGERLGLFDLNLKESIWVHAVSVGEAIAAAPLIKRLQVAYPNTPIVITTMTPTGSDRVKALFAKELNQSIYHIYVPYDISFAIQNFLKRVKPKLLVLMETEIWPNLIMNCHDAKVAMLIANGRLSPLSLKRYKSFRFFIKPLVSKINFVAAQSEMDKERFIQIGVPHEKVSNVGNIKFDISFSSEIIAKGKQLRGMIGDKRLVWIAASTHEGEEAYVLGAFKQLKSRFPDLLLLLVPRHPERFEKVAGLCTAAGFTIVKRTESKACIAATDIFLGDTMGEMGVFYAASDISFVGGSLVPVGGHNLLEPASLGISILTGPYLSNFVYISDALFEAEGAALVKDEQALIDAVAELLDNPALCHQRGQNALAVVEQNKGAIEGIIRLVARMMPL